MDRRVFLVPESLATEMLHALDGLVEVSERVARLRHVGHDEEDLPFEALLAAAQAWQVVRAYAAERSMAGGLIVAIPVPGHPDDDPGYVPGYSDDPLQAGV